MTKDFRWNNLKKLSIKLKIAKGKKNPIDIQKTALAIRNLQRDMHLPISDYYKMIEIQKIGSGE